MLLELSITDFAIIERSTIQFSDGLNALTGETGAGKSILLDALGAVLGARVSSDLVRTGARVARIEAAFDSSKARALIPAIFNDMGIDLDEPNLILSREIHATGRSSARINGRMATAGELSRLGSSLVDIHGQSDHLAILHTNEQRELLDRFGRLEGKRHSVAELVASWQAVRRQLRELTTDARARAQQVDLLRFQVEEISAAGLELGEDARLASERDILRNADRLRADGMGAVAVLDTDDPEAKVGALTLLREMAGMTADIAALDSGSTELNERANDVLVLAEELARDLRDYAESIESNAARLQAVEDRLALMQTLRRKYGSTIEEVMAYGEDATQQLRELTSAEFDADALTTRETHARAALLDSARELSAKRSIAAKDLAKQIERSIRELNLGSAHMAIEVATRPQVDGLESSTGERIHVDETGIDTVQFMMAPNAGEALKPLARVASGGETARLMLATKAILSEVDLTPTLVFDEIDVGIGGRSGQVVGEKLWSISRHHQVIVISHLAQIPAFADTHFKIEKSERDGRTVSSVRELNGDQRIEELATMIDGKPPTDVSRSNAREMRSRSIAWCTKQAAS